jgi:hypothetical protein
MFYKWFGNLMEVSGLDLRILVNPDNVNLKAPLGGASVLCLGMDSKFFNKLVTPCEVCVWKDFKECWGIVEEADDVNW